MGANESRETKERKNEGGGFLSKAVTGVAVAGTAAIIVGGAVALLSSDSKSEKTEKFDEQGSSSNPTIPRDENLISWDPPSPGLMKINTDGSVKNGEAAGGGLLRDFDGQRVKGFTFYIDQRIKNMSIDSSISRSNAKEEKRIKHYASSHKILLVGEGDFSFAACLARAFGSASNMVATSLDSKGELMLKYSRASMHLKELQDLGCTIIHEVDAHTMSQHPFLNHTTFDRIVFNFPHAPLKLPEHCRQQITLHKRVVKGFLKSARQMLSNNGEVHVTHKTSHPFSNWEIKTLAKEVGLYNLDAVKFYEWEYPGYQNKRGYGNGRKCDETFPVGQCCTYKFAGPLNMFI